MKKVIGMIGRIFIIGLLGALIGYDVYLFNATYVCNDVLPMPFGTGTAVIMSGSMEPEISVYDFVVIQKSDKYVVNDIITFAEGGKLVTHRIVEEKGDVFVTRGDANNTPDPAISKADILGKVVKVVPEIGRVTLFLQKPIGMLCLVMVLLGGMEISFRRSKSKKNKKINLVRLELEELKKEVEQISLSDIKLQVTEIDSEITIREKGEKNVWLPEKIELESSEEAIAFMSIENDNSLSLNQEEVEDDFDIDIDEFGLDDYDDFETEIHRNIAISESEEAKIKNQSEALVTEETLKETVKKYFDDEMKMLISEQMKEALEAIVQSNIDESKQALQEKYERREEKEKRQQQKLEKRKEKAQKTKNAFHKTIRRIRSISWKAMTLILFLLVIIALNIVSLTTQNNGNPFTFLGLSMVMIESNSMEPAIKANDVVILEKFEQYQTGEVITYVDNGDLITHRIQGVVEDGYLTKGDANISSDSYVVLNQNVIGKVIRVSSFLGLLIKVLLSPYIFGAIILALILYAVKEHRKGAYVERKIM